MKGPRELKRYYAKYGKYLKAIHYDSVLLFKLERCKKWYNRQQFKREYNVRDEHD